jgi:peptidoglycan/xylan/chitin deacetylase (PgdA/CDA1 family)
MEESMRIAAAYIFALSVSVMALGAAQAQQRPAAPAPAATGAPAPAAAPAAATAACPGNPNALGVSRVVEIDTTGGPGFGFEHFKQYDFLRDHEVVLTFDDGPWPGSTPAVLKALADQCTKALFFPIGAHAMWAPEILKQVAAAGHTIGSHTWSHQDLSKTRGRMPIGNGKWEVRDFTGKDEIEKGISAVRAALGQPPAAFFRFPALKQPPEMLAYLAERNIGIFSTDMDSFDFKLRKPEQVLQSVMNKLKTKGKGIVLMHDNHPWTAGAVPQILAQLKADGFKIVQVKAKDSVKSLAEYDDAVMKEFGGNTVSTRPISSVVRTIGE